MCVCVCVGGGGGGLNVGSGLFFLGGGCFKPKGFS